MSIKKCGKHNSKGHSTNNIQDGENEKFWERKRETVSRREDGQSKGTNCRRNAERYDSNIITYHAEIDVEFAMFRCQGDERRFEYCLR